MLKFYRDFNGHIACVFRRDENQVQAIITKAVGLQIITMSANAFARVYTRPTEVKTSSAILSWYARALSKTRNDPRALNILKENLMEKNLDEMTMDEVVDAHNKLATELGKATVDTFKSLKAARAALVKLQTPAAPKEPKVAGEGAVARGPVQGVGAFAKDQLLAGMSNKDAHAAVLAQFPTAKTSVACIAYYRTKLVNAGKLPRSERGAAKIAAEPAIEGQAA
jgi:hypothetical protein